MQCSEGRGDGIGAVEEAHLESEHMGGGGQF